MMQAKDIPVIGAIFILALSAGNYVVANFSSAIIVGFALDNIPFLTPLAPSFYLIVAIFGLIGVLHLLRKKRKK